MLLGVVDSCPFLGWVLECSANSHVVWRMWTVYPAIASSLHGYHGVGCDALAVNILIVIAGSQCDLLHGRCSPP